MGFIATLLRGIGYVPAILTAVENLFGPGNGSTKKNSSLALIQSVLGFGEAIAQKDIVDQDSFNEGLSKTIDGTVQMLNASVWHKAKKAA